MHGHLTSTPYALNPQKKERKNRFHLHARPLTKTPLFQPPRVLKINVRVIPFLKKASPRDPLRIPRYRPSILLTQP